MKRKQLILGIGASLGMLILILDGRTALEGARTGVELCLKTVIPSLFPFFILSIMRTSSFRGASVPGFQLLGRLFRIPKGAESILLSGFLGGYPVGARCISTAYHTGQLPKESAERMLAFCSNAGPAFLFGMVSAMFPEKWMVWALWGVHISSAVLVSLVIPNADVEIANVSAKSKITVSGALQSAIRVMATICAWVVLFRVVIAFLQQWILWLLPGDAQVMVIGLLELSNGCCELASVASVPVRFLICSGILAFGGLCVTMQTVSVTSGLSMRYYYLGKLLQTVFSLILSGSIICNMWQIVFSALLLTGLFLRKTQKKSSIQTAFSV